MHAKKIGLTLYKITESLRGDKEWRVTGSDAIRWQGRYDFSIEDACDTTVSVTGGTIELTMPETILDPIREWKINNSGILERNFKALTKDLDDFKLIDKGVKADTLVSSVFQYLQNEVVANFEYGAVYAAKLTQNNHDKSLNDYLDGLITTAKHTASGARNDLKLRLDDIEAAVVECKKNAKKRPKKHVKSMERYKVAIKAYYQDLLKIEIMEKTVEMIAILKKQINLEGYKNSLYPMYFGPMESMLTELKTTFESNLAFLNKPAPGDDEFAWKMVSFDGIKGNVDEQFNKQISNTPVIYRNFIGEIMEHYDKWADGDRHKVGKMITSYISNAFRPVLSASMDSYLNDKYGTHGNPQALQSKIQEDLLEEGVLAKAEPIFHINSNYTIATAQKHDLSVPAVEPNVCIAAQRIAAMKSLTVRLTGPSDRISAVKFESGIPLYAYGLIDDLERAYMSGGTDAIGRHLYEITDRNKDIDWEALPSVIPYSINPQSNWGGEEIEQLYYEAESRRIISEHPHCGGKYCVYELEMPELKGRYDFANGNEFQEYMKMLNSYKDNMGRVSSNAPMRKVHMLCNDGAGRYYNSNLDYRQICRIDYFIRFKNLQAAARNSMEVLDRVENALEEANNWIEEAKNN